MRVLRVVAVALTVLAAVGPLTVTSPAEAAFPGTNGTIAYVVDGNIRTINADGSGGALLVTDATGPQYSPDGTRLAFERADAVWVANSDGSAAQQVLANATYPAWSPDGGRLVFRRETAEFSGDLFVANADGSNVRQLTNTPELDESTPDWGVTGKIAYSRMRPNPDPGLEVVVVNPDGPDLRALTDSSRVNYDPDWSPEPTTTTA